MKTLYEPLPAGKAGPVRRKTWRGNKGNSGRPLPFKCFLRNFTTLLTKLPNTVSFFVASLQRKTAKPKHSLCRREITLPWQFDTKPFQVKGVLKVVGRLFSLYPNHTSLCVPSGRIIEKTVETIPPKRDSSRFSKLFMTL